MVLRLGFESDPQCLEVDYKNLDRPQLCLTFFILVRCRIARMNLCLVQEPDLRSTLLGGNLEDLNH